MFVNFIIFATRVQQHQPCHLKCQSKYIKVKPLALAFGNMNVDSNPTLLIVFSDEIFMSTGGCSEGEFQCDVNRCISQYKVCDQQVDCRDGSDEASEICGKGNAEA